MSFWNKQPSSRLGRSLATAITSGTVTQNTTTFGLQTYQIRVSSTLPLWLTLTSTAATANSDHFLPANIVDYFACTPGQALAFISTSTSSGYAGISEMT
ncbi:MAG: hypothetical protein WBX05_21430 [Pseudolabrys sp.]|jgi:hypothetical protein